MAAAPQAGPPDLRKAIRKIELAEERPGKECFSGLLLFVPYQLQKNESLAGGLKRIAEEQLSGAIEELQAPRDLHLGIYKARKYLKKVRSVLRLLAPRLGPLYTEENRRLRDVALRFSALRDARVSLELLEGFAERYKRKSTLSAQRRALAAKQAVLEHGTNWELTLAESVEALAATRKRIEDWPLGHLSEASLEAEIRKAHKHSRHASEKARKNRTPEHFHEFRKAVKRELNQNRLFEAGGMDDLKQLATMLGDHHNLAVLTLNVETASGRFRAMVRRDMRDLERKIVALGLRVYARTHHSELDNGWAEETMRKAFVKRDDRTQLSGRDSLRVSELLANPPAPNEKPRAAARALPRLSRRGLKKSGRH